MPANCRRGNSSSAPARWRGGRCGEWESVRRDGRGCWQQPGRLRHELWRRRRRGNECRPRRRGDNDRQRRHHRNGWSCCYYGWSCRRTAARLPPLTAAGAIRVMAPRKLSYRHQPDRLRPLQPIETRGDRGEVCSQPGLTIGRHGRRIIGGLGAKQEQCGIDQGSPPLLGPKHLAIRWPTTIRQNATRQAVCRASQTALRELLIPPGRSSTPRRAWPTASEPEPRTGGRRWRAVRRASPRRGSRP